MNGLKLAIIETGTPAAPLRAQFGGYADMFGAAFSRVDSGIVLENYPVYLDGDLPDMQVFDGAVITGSPLAVYEDHAFIAPLEDFIRHSLQHKIPVAGICFGHQIMAQAMGGHVEKSDKGWGVGVHDYEIVAHSNPMRLRTLFEPLKNLKCVLSHQDQVVSLSPAITRLGGSDFCPNGILEYRDGCGLSFQMHPEFTHDFAEMLLESRRDKIDKQVASVAKESFHQQTDRHEMLSILLAFFKFHKNEASKQSPGLINEKEKSYV